MSNWVMSIDVGQRVDYTAMVLIEARPDGTMHVARAKRLPKMLAYAEQVKHMVVALRGIISADPDAQVIVCVDRGQVGSSVEELLRDALRPLALRRVIVTGVDIVGPGKVKGTAGGTQISAPKDVLQKTTRVLYEQGNLSFARAESAGGNIPDALRTELVALEVLSVNPETGYAKWGSPGGASNHDDLALACLVGLFIAERRWSPKRRMVRHEPVPMEVPQRDRLTNPAEHERRIALRIMELQQRQPPAVAPEAVVDEVSALSRAAWAKFRA